MLFSEIVQAASWQLRLDMRSATFVDVRKQTEPPLTQAVSSMPHLCRFKLTEVRLAQ